MSRGTEISKEPTAAAENAALGLPRLPEKNNSNAREEDWRDRELARLQHQRELDAAARDALKPASASEPLRSGNSNLTEEAWRAKELAELQRQRELKALEAQRYSVAAIGPATLETVNSNKVEEQRRAQELARIKHQRDLDEIERMRYASAAPSSTNSNLKEAEVRAAQLQQIQRQSKIDGMARQSLSSAPEYLPVAKNSGATEFKKAGSVPELKPGLTEAPVIKKRDAEHSPSRGVPLPESSSISKTDAGNKTLRTGESVQSVKATDNKSTQAQVPGLMAAVDTALPAKKEPGHKATPSEESQALPGRKSSLPELRLGQDAGSASREPARQADRIHESGRSSVELKSPAETLAVAPEKWLERISSVQKFVFLDRAALTSSLCKATDSEPFEKSSLPERAKLALDFAAAVNHTAGKIAEQKFVLLSQIQARAPLRAFEPEPGVLQVGSPISEKPVLLQKLPPVERALPVENASNSQKSVLVEKSPEPAPRRTEAVSIIQSTNLDHSDLLSLQQDKLLPRALDGRTERLPIDLQSMGANARIPELIGGKAFVSAQVQDSGKRSASEQTGLNSSCDRIFPESDFAGRTESESFVARGFKAPSIGDDKRYLTGLEISLAALIAISATARAKDDDTDGGAVQEDGLRILRRRTHLVKADDTLQSIAEALYACADLAWLIADINRQNIKEEWVEGKRVIELRARQILELPDPAEINEFRRTRPKDFSKDGLVTVVSVGEIDRELLESLSPLLASARNRLEENPDSEGNMSKAELPKEQHRNGVDQLKIKEAFLRSLQAIGRELRKPKNASVASRI